MLTVPPVTEEPEESCSCLCEKQIPMRTQSLRDRTQGAKAERSGLGYKAALGNSVRYVSNTIPFFKGLGNVAQG